VPSPATSGRQEDPPVAVRSRCRIVCRASLPVEDDAPVLEVREVELPRNPAKGGAVQSGRLLDGTTIKMRADAKRRADVVEPARDASGEPEVTAAELLRGVARGAHGADAAEVLGSNLRWEKMMAAVLSLLIRKHLISIASSWRKLPQDLAQRYWAAAPEGMSRWLGRGARSSAARRRSMKVCSMPTRSSAAAVVRARPA